MAEYWLNVLGITIILVWGAIVFFCVKIATDDDFPWWVRWPMGFVGFFIFVNGLAFAFMGPLS